MKSNQYLFIPTIALITLIVLSGCSGMSEQGKSTAIGAGIGVVGHEVAK